MFDIRLYRSAFMPVKQIYLSDFSKVTTQCFDILSNTFTEALSNPLPSTDFTITDATQGRLDIISWKVYGRVDYWWVIGEYNGVVNPLYDLYSGRVIKIPERTSVDFLLQSKKYTSTDDIVRVVDIP